uniref:Selenoprotein O n=3 Tax=Rhodnius TaxID=13248 RepID=T1HB56_RHOPR
MSTRTEIKHTLLKNFKEFKFAPCKLLDLPIETNRDNYVRRNIHGVLFSHVDPSPLSSPILVSFSYEALTEILDLDPDVTKQPEFVDFIAGNNVIVSSTPLAHRYGGHQFGVWAMQLGDGRAILLGEYINSKGERWELQLKGAGRTPYSREGDGRAVLRSSIREYLCSEAMFYLGIPTSRAGAIIVSKDKVIRDLLYDGHPILESASVVLRIAPTWFRIGSFELLMRNGDITVLENLTSFVIKHHFPEIPDDDNKIINFLRKVFRLNSDLVVAWQSIGFTHGVMNTDNISIVGLTIDYGPFGFMEAYDPLYVPNHSDSEARYCYGNQVKIMLFNLLMLTQAVSPFLKEEQIQEIPSLLRGEANYIETKLEETFSKKLGFNKSVPELVKLLITIFEETKADFVMTFRDLSETPLSDLKSPSKNLWGLSSFAKHEQYFDFIELYERHFNETGRTDSERMEEMCKINPCYILRNWMAQDVIKAAENGDFSEVDKMLEILKSPFSRHPDAEAKGYASIPPSWAKTLCLSCSS